LGGGDKQYSNEDGEEENFTVRPQFLIASPRVVGAHLMISKAQLSFSLHLPSII